MNSQSVQQSSGAAAQSSSFFLSGNFILLLYAGMLVFFVFQIVRGQMAMKKLEEPKYEFSSRGRTMNLVIAALIAGAGVATIFFQKEYATGCVMILLGLVFLFHSRGKIIIAANGIYGENRFIPWSMIKRWGWDQKAGNLILATKEYGKAEVNEIIHVGRELMQPVNERIREFKLKKK